MSHTLVVMRHAKSSWKTNDADLNRPLSGRGTRDAVVAGQRLAGTRFDLVLISPAAMRPARRPAARASSSRPPSVRAWPPAAPPSSPPPHRCHRYVVRSSPSRCHRRPAGRFTTSLAESRIQRRLRMSEHQNDDALTEETLVEEVSIDGMCGVY